MAVLRNPPVKFYLKVSRNISELQIFFIFFFLNSTGRVLSEVQTACFLEEE